MLDLVTMKETQVKLTRILRKIVIVTTCVLVPMDLESDDEDKENGGDGVNDKELDENEEIDEKERSHCMEELWDGG